MKRRLLVSLLFAAVAFPLAGAKPSDDALALVPADAASAGLVRVLDLRASPLFDRVFHETGRISGDADAARFFAETGLNPKLDVDLVVFAGSPARSGSGWVLVAFEGRFDAAKLASAAAARGAERKSTADGDYFLLKDTKHEGASHENGAIAFVSNRLIVAGTETAVAQALSRRAAGGGGFAAGAGLGHETSRIDPKASAWALVDMAKVPMAGRRGGGSGDEPAAAIVSAMQSVTLVALSVTADGDSLKLSATGVSGDAETRQNLEDAIRGVLAVWRMAVQEKQPDLVPVLRGFRVTQGDDSVTLAGTLPGPVLRELSARKMSAAR
ncbi:MAG TPA: hypothetical protein VL084_08370 [Thermoanaerobaculia bacterium]|nr:hypothetical protein [Thermoanaerobaculia bacterium]